MKNLRFWVGAGISGGALWLAFRQVELGQVGEALGSADYGLVGLAAMVQLLVVGAIAGRWGLLFRQRPRFWGLVSALLIAQLVNGVMPVRLGMLVRAYLVGREEGQSKIAVFATVVAEKVFDSLGLVLLAAAVLPLVAADWSALRLSTGLFAGLFPALVLVTYQRQRVLRLVKGALRWAPWAERVGLVQKFEAGLEGLVRLRGGRALAALWAWTLVVFGLGALVNYVVLRAVGIQAPFAAAVLLLVALQVGSKMLPAAPLAGIGIFQAICVGVLELFGVDRGLALSCGFALHFAVFAPGAALGALALYRAHGSLRQLRAEAEKGERSCLPSSVSPP